MLIVKRKIGEKIHIRQDVECTLINADKNTVTFSLKVPKADDLPHLSKSALKSKKPRQQ
jgi:carbon storage regulator CsrA